MKSSRIVASEFIVLARNAGESLTPMQLLKLVYIAHGWMLALHHRPLIKDDVQAWQYGPVIPSLYNAIRKFRANPVLEVSGVPNENLDDDEKSITRHPGLDPGPGWRLIPIAVKAAPEPPVFCVCGTPLSDPVLPATRRRWRAHGYLFSSSPP